MMMNLKMCQFENVRNEDGDGINLCELCAFAVRKNINIQKN